MRRLWAPWRMDYIRDEKPKVGCLFCQKLSEGNDAENLVLHRTERAFVMMNLYPYGNGHLMVAPRRHTGDLLDLSAEEMGDVMALAQRSVSILTQALDAHGFNLGLNLGEAAGAGITEHLHVHIVPRWRADTNFMPILADVKVMPEHLQSSYEVLRPQFSSDGKG